MFDRSEPRQQDPNITARLERLDSELTSGTRRVDQVNASHSGHRFNVIVERMSPEPRRWREPMDYKATAVFEGSEIVAFAYTPSAAFAKLTKRLSWVVDKAHYDLNAAAITA